MLASIGIAVVTLALIFTGVFVSHQQSEDSVEAEETEAYDEGFYGSLNTLVEGLNQSAERGAETKVDRYQEYLKLKERGTEAVKRIQSAPKVSIPSPSTSGGGSVRIQTSIAPTPTVVPQAPATVQVQPRQSSPSNSSAVDVDLDSLDDDLDFDLDFDFDFDF